MTYAFSTAAIALNRFGLGARPDDTISNNSRRFVLAQFDRYEPMPADYARLADAGAIVQRYRRDRRADKRSDSRALDAIPGAQSKAILQSIRQDFRADAQALYRAAVRARTIAALQTEAPFIERLVHFWSNHFCVSADTPELLAFSGAFERDAIRPHVLGRFEDMLIASERHPAMLLYLNQTNSIGPNSSAAARYKGRHGLNENLGREIMELHTLGVRSGYAQGDVTEFARALTGWTVDGLSAGGLHDGDPNGFAFRPQFHEPGPRTILGKRYSQSGEDQANAALVDFAKMPATARHVATKLARHFAGDDPPPELIDRIATTFTKSRGDLPSLYHALIASPELWVSRPLKFKTPWEWSVSALRGLGRTQADPIEIAALQSELGQTVWKPGSPAGFDDFAASWAAPDALMRRVEVAQRLAASLGGGADARLLAQKIIPASLDTPTSEQIARSESPAGAIALLLVSPAFLRR